MKHLWTIGYEHCDRIDKKDEIRLKIQNSKNPKKMFIEKDWVSILPQYFGSSFKTRDSSLLKLIQEQEVCFSKLSASFWDEHCSSRRLFELDLFAFQITINCRIELCWSPKTRKMTKIHEIFRKSNKQKCRSQKVP